MLARLVLVTLVILVGLCATLVTNWLYVEPREHNRLAIEGNAQHIETLDLRYGSLKARIAEYDDPVPAVVSDNAYLSSTNADEASAYLQSTVRRLIGEVGGVIETSQANAAATNNDRQQISVFVRGRIGEDGLIRLLARINDHRPVLLIDSFEIQQLPNATGDNQLSYSAALVGYMTHAT